MLFHFKIQQMFTRKSQLKYKTGEWNRLQYLINIDQSKT